MLQFDLIIGPDAWRVASGQQGAAAFAVTGPSVRAGRSLVSLIY